MDQLRYLVDALAALCGFDSPQEIGVGGVLVVILAAGLLVYVVYRAALLSLWPGEAGSDHIKRRVLDEDGNCAD